MEWWWEEKWADFRRGDSMINLEWADGSCTIRLYDYGVPATSAAFCEVLPLQIPLVHVAWSGDMLMGTETLALDVEGQENFTRLPRPGEIAFDPKHDELTLTYGTAECRLPSGENTVCVFGTVQSGLDDFAAFARSRRFEGIATVAFSVG